ncbi:PspC domain-containing protein [Bifidobacterium aquikefiri]
MRSSAQIGNNGIMHFATGTENTDWQSPADTVEHRGAAGSHRAAGPSGNPALLPARYPLLRPRRGRLISGVCRGVALHLGMRTWVVRLIALAMIPCFGAGIVAYVLLTISVRAGDPTVSQADGAALHVSPLAKGNVADALQEAQPGVRPDEKSPHVTARTSMPLIIGAGAIVMLSFGWLLAARGLPVNVIVPVLLTASAMALSWLQIDRDDVGVSGAHHAAAARGSGMMTRLFIAIALLFLALVVYACSTYALMQAAQVVFIALLLLTGVAVALVPWANSMMDKLGAEHALKEREEERADMTAHLHDGVLQTLALIQLHADEPSAVATLARSQERSLRDWLYQTRIPAERSVSSGIRDIAAKIEVEQGKAIEVVTVADAHPCERSEALLDATRQALLNAATHGGEPISVYCEVHDDAIEVFVRDHGDGFDVDAIPLDRLGIRESIVGRLQRKGGSATIVSKPHWGSEVRMNMPLKSDGEAKD